MYKSIIIIGAPRSGTNMLRDMLTRLPGFGTWPCDEINYIWRYGNMRFQSDEFTPEMAKYETKKYIRRSFDWVSRKYCCNTVVEKTCANSLRVEFVERVIPSAKYIFLYRDGLDVVESAFKRWHATPDFSYLMRKIRFIPITNIPYYGTRHLWNRLYQLTSSKKQLAFWGPKLENMSHLIKQYSIEEICAIQWKKCVQSSKSAFRQIPTERWLEVGYEDLVKDPINECQRLLDFIGIKFNNKIITLAVKDVSTVNIGKGRRKIDAATQDKLFPIINGLRISLGYV